MLGSEATNHPYIIKLQGKFQTPDTLVFVFNPVMCGDLWTLLHDPQDPAYRCAHTHAHTHTHTYTRTPHTPHTPHTTHTCMRCNRLPRGVAQTSRSIHTILSSPLTSPHPLPHALPLHVSPVPRRATTAKAPRRTPNSPCPS